MGICSSYSRRGCGRPPRHVPMSCAHLPCVALDGGGRVPKTTLSSRTWTRTALRPARLGVFPRVLELTTIRLSLECGLSRSGQQGRSCADTCPPRPHRVEKQGGPLAGDSRPLAARQVHGESPWHVML